VPIIRTTTGRRDILLIDDNQLICSIASDLLYDRGGFGICAVETAELGLLWLADHDFAAVIVDYWLADQGMTGLEFVQTVRNTLSEVPILGMSGDDSHGHEFIAAGCNAFLLKPLRDPPLLDVLAEVLTYHKLQNVG